MYIYNVMVKYNAHESYCETGYIHSGDFHCLTRLEERPEQPLECGTTHSSRPTLRALFVLDLISRQQM